MSKSVMSNVVKKTMKIAAIPMLAAAVFTVTGCANGDACPAKIVKMEPACKGMGTNGGPHNSCKG